MNGRDTSRQRGDIDSRNKFSDLNFYYPTKNVRIIHEMIIKVITMKDSGGQQLIWSSHARHTLTKTHNTLLAAACVLNFKVHFSLFIRTSFSCLSPIPRPLSYNYIMSISEWVVSFRLVWGLKITPRPRPCSALINVALYEFK